MSRESLYLQEEETTGLDSVHLAPLMSSTKLDWETPDKVLDLVRFTFCGPIRLDPCTTSANPTQAQHIYTRENSGLDAKWDSDFVYANPPYGRELPQWVDKIVTEYLRGCQYMLVLVPARTDTKWFRRLYDFSGALCLFSGRLKFRGAKASAPFPSAMFGLSVNYERFLTVFEDYGIVINPRNH